MAWAYAMIITKRLKEVNSIQINIHLGYCLIFTAGIAYPIEVIDKTPLHKMIISLFACGLVMAIAAIAFIGALTMTENTGVLTMLMFTSVIVGYIVSITRYG